MKLRTIGASVAVFAFMLSGAVASADTLSVSCAGTPGTSAITWTGTTAGGIAPEVLLWGNGATTSTQTVSYLPGTYSMDIQATDASSTVATSTCAATVAQSAPSIGSFSASPASILPGGSALLSWAVTNASSTSIDNGVGVVTGTSVLVVPTVTTTYTLTATNPSGSTTAQTTVNVATSTSNSSLQDQIQALLQQIHALQQQILQLISNAGGSSATTTPPIIPPGQVGKGACVTLNRGLSIGDKGDDVKSIQEMLSEDPEDGFNVAPTGYFGPLTAQAMVRFQERNGIASSTQTDGSVGPLTRGFFERHCGEGLMKQGEDSSSTSSASVQAPMIPYHPGQSGEQHGQSGEHGNGNGQDN